MTTFPKSPKVLKAGILLLDPLKGSITQIIQLQYTPESLSRSFQIQGVGGEGGERSEALRLKGPPVETLKIEAEIDAADQLDRPQEFPDIAKFGITSQLSALETLVYPDRDQLIDNQTSVQEGVWEIMPMEQPLTVFVWGRARQVPVRVTEFSVTEEAFTPNLYPLRAKVSLGMRVLSVNDLPVGHKGAELFLAYHQTLEQRAKRGRTENLGSFRIGDSLAR